MATLLYRMGRFSYQRRWLVLAVWLVVLVGAGAGAAALKGPTSTTFTIPGTESQKALDLLAERLPNSGADGASARVVFIAPKGQQVTSPASTAAIEKAVASLKALPHVAAVADPVQTKAMSADGTTALATVTYTLEASAVTPADQAKLLAAGRTVEAAGLRVEFGGEAVQAQAKQGAGEAIGVGVAAIVLVITFGSMLAAGLPLLTAIIAVSLGMLGITIASGFTDISSSTQSLAMMLGLAVAIDYALFIVSRYRHEVLTGKPGDEAAGRAVGTAGSAVVFAGATVVVALAALSVVGIPFLTAMGLAAAGTVAGAVVIALTLVPALLGFMGSRVLGRRARSARDTEVAPRGETVGVRWARFVIRRRVLVVAVGVLTLGALALPAAGMRLGMPSDGTASEQTTQRRAYDALAAGFGPGFNGPLVVVADLKTAVNVTAAVSSIQASLAKVPGVATVAPPSLSPAKDLAIYSVIPTSGPDDPATERLVKAIRSASSGWKATAGATVLVTGATAVGIDVSSTLSDALLPYLAVVVGLSLVLLTFVFRSILVPVKATVGFLLSMAATFGAVVAVFQHGWGAQLLGVGSTGPILSFLPILLIGLLFGLAMDYEVFLVTRMREEYVHGANADEAVVGGFRHGARVVTAAAIIMMSVFAGFILAPEMVIKSMGFALAAGVLFDAFVVRMTLVPAVMSLLGDRAWSLPSWLDRVLPRIDIEGEHLAASGVISPDDREPALTH